MRTWLAQVLDGAASLTALLPGGIHQASSVQQVPAKKPFMVYRFRIEEGVIPAEGHFEVVQAPVDIWVHDEVGDYVRIEDIIQELKDVLEAQPHGNGFIAAEWSFTSQDLQDEDWKTITKYCRYLLKFKR